MEFKDLTIGAKVSYQSNANEDIAYFDTKRSGVVVAYRKGSNGALVRFRGFKDGHNGGYMEDFEGVQPKETDRSCWYVPINNLELR